MALDGFTPSLLRLARVGHHQLRPGDLPLDHHAQVEGHRRLLGRQDRPGRDSALQFMQVGGRDGGQHCTW